MPKTLRNSGDGSRTVSARRKSSPVSVSMTEGEQLLWAYVTKDVQPLHQNCPHKEESPLYPTFAETMVSTGKPVTEKEVLSRPRGWDIDRRTDQKLQRGRYPIDFILDLHGHNQQEAYELLSKTLNDGFRQGFRCILVITGKGAGGKGVLRNSVPEWLSAAPLSTLVLRFYNAKPVHGGAGALYVLLRRKRTN